MLIVSLRRRPLLRRNEKGAVAHQPLQAFIVNVVWHNEVRRLSTRNAQLRKPREDRERTKVAHACECNQLYVELGGHVAGESHALGLCYLRERIVEQQRGAPMAAR